MKKIIQAVIRKFFVYNPNTHKIASFRKPGLYSFIPFVVIGLASLIWFLIRVIPKPSRATYPCMKVAMPLAYSFMGYIVALVASVLFFRKAIAHFRTNRYKYAVLFMVIGIIVSAFTLGYQSEPSYAGTKSTQNTLFSDPIGSNSPIGTAKGILPGRVVWVYDPNATNENCSNLNFADAYWLEKNTNQTVVDSMFSDGILSLTGKTTHAEAWDAIFHYFNINHGKGDIGYTAGETVFIKINAVTAYGGLKWSDGDMTSSNAIEFDTSPQAIMALLRHLINEAHVPQNKIYIGDPIADIYNYMVDKFSSEFPDINYCSKNTITGRTKLTASLVPGIYYSDKGTVMDQVTSHNLFLEMMEADYLINMPSMKGHRWAGVTLGAKNHFGSNTTSGSYQLHKGLMNPDNTPPLRTEYRSYRVFVDLMASKYMGGNTMLFFLDALWSTSYEHQKPQKFQSSPFNNDWSSSFLLSLDPVAIESVGLDLLQKEFHTEELVDGYDAPGLDRFGFVLWPGIDDYLHQAADTNWWPAGIKYDPDNSGTHFTSLGVHEHWNDTINMQYTRNLLTGNGIELIKIFTTPTLPSGSVEYQIGNAFTAFPNPVISTATIRFQLEQNARVTLEIFSTDGKQVEILFSGQMNAGLHEIGWNPEERSGQFISKLKLIKGSQQEEKAIRLEVL